MDYILLEWIKLLWVFFSENDITIKQVTQWVEKQLTAFALVISKPLCAVNITHA